MADTETQKPILDLNTLIERPTIRIDGKLYEVRSPEELSIIDSQRVQRWGEQINELSKDEDKASELNDVIDKVTRFILPDIPDDVFAKLVSAHKMQIALAFTGLLTDRVKIAAGALKEAAKKADKMADKTSTGETSSRGSSASTAGRRAGGSKKRRRRS